jgi:hypothetical protein
MQHINCFVREPRTNKKISEHQRLGPCSEELLGLLTIRSDPIWEIISQSLVLNLIANRKASFVFDKTQNRKKSVFTKNASNQFLRFPWFSYNNAPSYCAQHSEMNSSFLNIDFFLAS